MLKGFLHISETIIMILLIFVMLFQFMTIPKIRMEWERPKLTLMSQDFIHAMDMSGIAWLDASDVQARFSQALPSTMGYILTTTQEVRPLMKVGCVCNDTEFSIVSQEVLADFDLNGPRRRFSLERIDPSNLQFSTDNDVIIFWGYPGIADLSIDDTNMRRYLSLGKGIVEFSDLDESKAGMQWHRDVFNLLWVDPSESFYVSSPNARLTSINAPNMGYKVHKLFYHTPFELVPEPSMAGHFRFNRGSGFIALDTSPNSNNGDLLDYDPGNADAFTVPEWVDGKFGHALLFDGVDDYVQIPSGPGLQFSDEMTVEAWVYSHDALGDTERMEFVGRMSSFSLRNDERDYPEIGAPGPIFEASLSDGNFHGVGYLGSPPPAANGWHHYVGVFDSAARGLELWVDGVLIIQNTSFAGLNIDDNANPITIGGHVSGVNFFDGMIEEVILYDRALSPGEIQLHYNRSMNRPTTFVNFVTESVYPIDNVSDKIILELDSKYVGGAFAGRSVPLATISWGIEGNGRTAWMSGGKPTVARKQLLKSLIMWAANENEYKISTEGDLKESVKASLVKVLNTDMPEIIMVELTLGFFF
ncbi:MAG: LamG domain-containing protein [Candidatus Aenigmarchaeota archaeon]|nr:LamG domain-containing protein [Candidatus Aenigmarchaeota archaeon]